MADRRLIDEEMNRINKLYQDYDLQMRKSGATMEERQKMRDMLNAKKERLILEQGDHLQNMNAGRGVLVPGGTVTTVAKDVGEGLDAMDIRKKGIIKGVGKKMLAGLPVIGGAVQALQSGDASAAIPGLDEAEDVGFKVSAESVTTIAAQLVATALLGRKRIAIQNLGNQPIFIGFDGTVTSANGLRVSAGAYLELPFGEDLDVFAIAGAGTQSIRVVEIG